MPTPQTPYGELDADHDRIKQERLQQVERQRKEEADKRLRDEQQRAEYQLARDAEYRQRQDQELLELDAQKQKQWDDFQRQKDELWREEHGPDAERSTEFRVAERRTLEKEMDDRDQQRELNDIWNRESCAEQERADRAARLEVHLAQRAAQRGQEKEQTHERGLDIGDGR